jgi:TolA-binding protein
MIYGLESQSEKKISTLKRLYTDFPRSHFIPDAYFELGSEYLALKNNREAEKYFMYVIDDFKGNPLVGKSYAVLGRMYYNANQDNKAVEMYTRLYKEYPGTAEAKAAAEQVKRIYIENGRPGDYDKWIKDMGVSIPASEKDSLYYEVAYTYYTKSDYKNAINSFATYLREMQNGAFVVSAHYYKAIAHETLKQNKEAIEDYKVVADANGSEFQEDAVLSLLRLYGPNAPCEEMVPYLDKIEKLTKVREIRYKAWTELLHCYQKMKRIADAREIAAKIGDELSCPDDLKAEALVFEGVAFYDEKKYQDALDKFSDAYTKYNNRFAAEAKYREAVVFYAQNNTEQCKTACYYVMDQYSSYDYWVGKAMLLLGDAFLSKGEEANAKAVWNNVVDNFDTPEIVNEAKEKLAKLKNKIKTNNINEE